MKIFLILCALALSAPAHAWYHPSLGRFINRDPGVELGRHGYPMVNRQFQTHRRVYQNPDPYGLIANTYPGAGYHDGLSLYRAYFVPNHLDPTGLAISGNVAGDPCPYAGAIADSGWYSFKDFVCEIDCCGCDRKLLGTITGTLQGKSHFVCTPQPNGQLEWEESRYEQRCRSPEGVTCNSVFGGHAYPCGSRTKEK